MNSVASSDWEYVAGANDETEEQTKQNEGEENNTVVVEVPTGMFPPGGVGGLTTCVSGGDQASETSSTKFYKSFVNLNLASATSSVNSEVSSSFVGFGDVGCAPAWTTHRSNNHDEETASSWSAIPSVGSTSVPDSTSGWSASTSAYWSMPPSNTASSSGSTGSVVSNFDVLSLGGTVRHRCKRCSFHNTETAFFCEICGLPLIANPCLDADLQVAINQQLKEERNYEQDLLIKEKKRKTIHSEPIFEQANFLVSEVTGAVCQLGKPFDSVDKTLLGGPSILLASQFIEMMQKQGRERPIAVTIKYIITPSDRFALRNLRCTGFGNSYTFGDDMETAIDLFNRSRTVSTGGPLFAVPEHKHPDEPYSCPALAWIVAVMESTTSPIIAPPGHTQTPTKAWKVRNSGQTLPLASFPATEVMISEENLNRAAKLLNRVCEDFFLSEPTTDDDEALARALAESFENERAGSSSLQSSWLPPWQEPDQKKPRIQQDTAVGDEVSCAVADKDHVTDGPISFENKKEEPSSDESITEGKQGCVPSPDLLGRRVQLLHGSFEGHIGTVESSSPDGNHINVVIETIRNHSPGVMISKDHVKPVAEQPQQDTQKECGAPRSSPDDDSDATRKVSHFLSMTSDFKARGAKTKGGDKSKSTHPINL